MINYEQTRQKLASEVHRIALETQQTREKKGINPEDSDFAIANAHKLLAAFGLSLEAPLMTEVSQVEVAEIANQIAAQQGDLRSCIYYDAATLRFIGTVT